MVHVNADFQNQKYNSLVSAFFHPFSRSKCIRAEMRLIALLKWMKSRIQLIIHSVIICAQENGFLLYLTLHVCVFHYLANQKSLQVWRTMFPRKALTAISFSSFPYHYSNGRNLSQNTRSLASYKRSHHRTNKRMSEQVSGLIANLISRPISLALTFGFVSCTKLLRFVFQFSFCI